MQKTFGSPFFFPLAPARVGTAEEQGQRPAAAVHLAPAHSCLCCRRFPTLPCPWCTASAGMPGWPMTLLPLLPAWHALPLPARPLPIGLQPNPTQRWPCLGHAVCPWDRPVGERCRGARGQSRSRVRCSGCFICSPRADRPLAVLPGAQGAAEPCPQGHAHPSRWPRGPCYEPGRAQRQNRNCGCLCITNP